jgi:hypothetical protein
MPRDSIRQVVAVAEVQICRAIRVVSVVEKERLEEGCRRNCGELVAARRGVARCGGGPLPGGGDPHGGHAWLGPTFIPA